MEQPKQVTLAVRVEKVHQGIDDLIEILQGTYGQSTAEAGQPSDGDPREMDIEDHIGKLDEELLRAEERLGALKNRLSRVMEQM